MVVDLCISIEAVLLGNVSGVMEISHGSRRGPSWRGGLTESKHRDELVGVRELRVLGFFFKFAWLLVANDA